MTDSEDLKRKQLSEAALELTTTATQLHEKLAAATEKAGYVARAASAIRDGYQFIAEARDPSTSDFAASGINLLNALNKQMAAVANSSSIVLLDPLAHNVELACADLAVSGSVLGFRQPSMPCPFLPGSDPERYAAVLERLNPAMARSYRQAWSSRYGAKDDPERVGLWELRQTFDHFFEVIAPDDAVRASGHWKKKDKEPLNAVHRRERLAYAAEQLVADPAERALLESTADDALRAYGDLNKAHVRGALAVEHAFDAFDAFDTIFRRWIDAAEKKENSGLFLRR